MRCARAKVLRSQKRENAGWRKSFGKVIVGGQKGYLWVLCGGVDEVQPWCNEVIGILNPDLVPCG